MAEIAFRSVTPPDLPLIRRWMDGAHWREWWGDPDTELGQVRDMIEGRDSTRPFIFELDGEPSGYIQMWYVRDARCEPWQTEAPWVNWLPEEAIGVDLSIGPAPQLSRGLGSAVLAAFVARLRAQGHADIFIDPDPANARAIRAYTKAGFRPDPDYLGRTPDCLLMRHYRESET